MCSTSMYMQVTKLTDMAQHYYVQAISLACVKGLGNIIVDTESTQTDPYKREHLEVCERAEP